MQDLLILPQRFPYPPNKGDKIPTWNILKHLSKQYRVYLEGLNKYCKNKSLTGLLTGNALSLTYYRHPGMQAWVKERLAAGVKYTFVFYSAMARYVVHAPNTV